MDAFYVDRPEQWEVLSSPLRMEIVAQLELYGTRSIAEVARELGRSPPSLYHHFRKLLEVQIVEIERTRKSGAREEALYRVRGRPVVLRFEPNTPRTRALRSKVAASSLRQAQRDFEASVEAAQEDCDQPELRRYRMRLSPASFARIQEHLDAIVELILSEKLTAAECAADTRWYTWVSMLAPQERTVLDAESPGKESG